MVIKALNRVLQTAAHACESEVVMESIAQSLDATAQTLKQESITMESAVQVLLEWSAHVLSCINSLLEQDIVRNGFTDVRDALHPALASVAEGIEKVSEKLPVVSYVVSQLQGQVKSQGENLVAIWQSRSVQSAFGTATALTASAWNIGWNYYQYGAMADPDMEKLRRELRVRSKVSFASASSLDTLLVEHALVRDALVAMAMEQNVKIKALEASLAETSAFATELSEAIARGPSSERRKNHTI
jgi:hypothetical protein